MPNGPNEPENDPKAEKNNSSEASLRPQTIVEMAGKKLHEISGDITNQLVSAAVHTDLAQKFSAPINGALARDYIKGRSILEQRQAQGKGGNDLTGLSSEEQSAVQSYQKVHGELPAQIPFIDRDALVREVERHIEIKAKIPPAPTQTHEKTQGIQTQPTARESQTRSPSQTGTKEVSRTPPPAVSKERSIAPPTPPATKEIGIKPPNTPATKETGIKPPNTPATKETSIKAPDFAQSKKPSDNALAASANKDSSARPTPPRPNEPEARELKSVRASGSAENVSVPRNVPQPGAPAKDEAREPHAEATQLNKTYSQAEKGPQQIPLKIATNLVEGGSSTARSPWPGVAARLNANIESTSRPSHPGFHTPQSEAYERLAVPIRRQESKTVQLVTVIQALPFGRRFGEVERLTPLKTSQKTQPPTEVQSTKSLSDVRQLRLPIDNKTANESHTAAAITNAGRGTTSGAHTDDTSRRRANSHISTEYSTGKGSHTDSQSTPNSESHANSESHVSNESVDTPEGGHEPEILISHDSHGAHEQPETEKTLDEVVIREEKALCDTGDRTTAIKTYVVKGLMPDKRYITGGELAFVTIMALASASRVRPGENAAEQGLVQSRREFVMVEEESWIEPEYILPSDKIMPDKPRRNNSALDEIKDEEAHVQIQQEHLAQDQVGQRQKTTTKRKVLLRPQIMVQEGDNLSQMAEALFNDSRYGHLIADLNIKTIDDTYVQETRIVRLITRQRLSLPVYQDTIQFDAGRLAEIGDIPLITIVESTAIDRELLKEGLSPILGLNSKNRDPLENDDK